MTPPTPSGLLRYAEELPTLGTYARWKDAHYLVSHKALDTPREFLSYSSLISGERKWLPIGDPRVEIFESREDASTALAGFKPTVPSWEPLPELVPLYDRGLCRRVGLSLGR